MTEEIQDELKRLRERFHEDDDGATALSCFYDRYPTSLDCQCGHGHGRHTGKPGSVHCMSYWSQEDCDCTEYVPAAHAVRSLWESHGELLAALNSVLGKHLPYRTHNALSNPDFWYEVCTNCADESGEWALYPCATVLKISAALGLQE